MTVQAPKFSLGKSFIPDNHFVPKFALIIPPGAELDGPVNAKKEITEACADEQKLPAVGTICAEREAVVAKARNLQEKYKNVAKANFPKLDPARPHQSFLEKLHNNELDLTGTTLQGIEPIAQAKSDYEKKWFDSWTYSFTNLITKARDKYVSPEGFDADVENTMANIIDGDYSKLNYFFLRKINLEKFKVETSDLAAKEASNIQEVQPTVVASETIK